MLLGQANLLIDARSDWELAARAWDAADEPAAAAAARERAEALDTAPSAAK